MTVRQLFPMHNSSWLQRTTGLVQDFYKQIQVVVKDYTWTKINSFKEPLTPKTRYAGSRKCRKCRKCRKSYISWHFTNVHVRSSPNLSWILLLLTFCIFIAANEINSKNSQISWILLIFQGIILIFKEFIVPLKRHFKFQPFSRSSRTCTSLGLWICSNCNKTIWWIYNWRSQRNIGWISPTMTIREG